MFVIILCQKQHLVNMICLLSKVWQLLMHLLHKDIHTKKKKDLKITEEGERRTFEPILEGDFYFNLFCLFV